MNDSTESKNRLVLKLPRFSLAYKVRGKCGNFKTSQFLGSVESFLFFLSSKNDHFEFFEHVIQK